MTGSRLVGGMTGAAANQAGLDRDLAPVLPQALRQPGRLSRPSVGLGGRLDQMEHGLGGQTDVEAQAPMLHVKEIEAGATAYIL